MSEELKPLPCPFEMCGSSAVYTNESTLGEFWCECDNCEARGPLSETEDRAIQAWNTRTE